MVAPQQVAAVAAAAAAVWAGKIHIRDIAIANEMRDGGARVGYTCLPFARVRARLHASSNTHGTPGRVHSVVPSAARWWRL